MILPDANLLLFAYDQSSPFPPKAAAWCENIMSRSSLVLLLPVVVVFAFVRTLKFTPRIWISAGLQACISAIRPFEVRS